MKKNYLILCFTGICALLLSLLPSCEKEFNPRDKYKAITVVYGLVNPADSVHYIRIHKAFLGPEDIIVMAQNPDSSTYPVEDIDVRIYDITPDGNTTQLEVKTTEIENKEEGYFSQKQRVYYFEKTFEKQIKQGVDYYEPKDVIKIEIEHLKTKKIVYAETPLVNSFNVQSPMTGVPLSLDPTKSSSKFIWNNAKNGRIYDIYYTMYYGEGHIADSSSNKYETKSLVWHVGSYSASKTGDESYQTENFQFNPAAFYAQILKDIPYNTSVFRRPYDSVEVALWCGSEVLYYYHNINDPSQGVAQERPEYTNMQTKVYSEDSGGYQDVENEAFGIFTSRIVQYRYIHMSSDMTQKYLPELDRQFIPVPIY